MARRVMRTARKEQGLRPTPVVRLLPLDPTEEEMEEDDYSEDDKPGQWLSWRMAPQESFSDWTIQISKLEEDKLTTTKPAPSTTYHVHRSVLAFGGPKKCAYFATLFQNSNFTESETKTSKIDLHAIAATAFPCMLDYLYSQDDELNITNENATALYHLGQYFGCQALQEKAVQFCKPKISIGNCATYYKHAKVFKADKIMEVVVRFCCLNLKRITPDSHLMKVSDAALWKSIIHLILEILCDNYSKHLSLLIAEFCMAHQDHHVDAETFAKFVDVTTVIAEKAAVPLLQLEGALRPGSKKAQELTGFQLQCIEALADSSVTTLEQDLEGLNPNLLAAVRSKALEKAV